MSDDQGPRIDHAVIAVPSLDRAAECYQALGFTLTPRAAHPDHMGTANRLAQFTGGNFIELVEIDRPHLLMPHDFTAAPARFGFGAHNQGFLTKRHGMSALVFATEDAEAEAARLADAGFDAYRPLHFERRATQPDGSETGVAFTLAFATSPHMPEIAFYFCQNHFPENFWKPAFQSHANGAGEITRVVIAAPNPARHSEFLARLIGAPAIAVDDGIELACGPRHKLAVVPSDSESVLFTGLEIERENAMTSDPVDACGVTIGWRTITS